MKIEFWLNLPKSTSLPKIARYLLLLSSEWHETLAMVWKESKT
uniref:Hypotheticial protein n=1 Tax=Schistosoma japonicum TaxID=6182 RepID=C7TXY4_SCHJA|nr:hypotheticial protein [Schistosoma japonicum]